MSESDDSKLFWLCEHLENFFRKMLCIPLSFAFNFLVLFSTSIQLLMGWTAYRALFCFAVV